MKKAKVITTSLIALALLCGIGAYTVHDQQAKAVTAASIDLHGNPAFQDKVDQVQPLTFVRSDDSTPLQTDVRAIQVLDENGKIVTLNLAKQPLLFFFYNCKYCQSTFENWNPNAKLPILISTNFKDGTSLEVAKYLTAQEIKNAPLIKGAKVYYLIKTPGFIKHYPTLTYATPDGEIRALVGGHYGLVWKEVLEKAKH